MSRLPRISGVCLAGVLLAGVGAAQQPSRSLDAIVDEAMAATGAKGLAVAVVRNGKVAAPGEGLILLQFVLEKGLGLDVGLEMQRRLFDRFGLKTTSMMWRADFAANLADGWKADGSVEPHDERSKVRRAVGLGVRRSRPAALKLKLDT